MNSIFQDKAIRTSVANASSIKFHRSTVETPLEYVTSPRPPSKRSKGKVRYQNRSRFVHPPSCDETFRAPYPAHANHDCTCAVPVGCRKGEPLACGEMPPGGLNPFVLSGRLPMAFISHAFSSLNWSSSVRSSKNFGRNFKRRCLFIIKNF